MNITIVWLNSITIAIEDKEVTIDCYGCSNGRIFIIESKSYHGITDIIDAWSV